MYARKFTAVLLVVAILMGLFAVALPASAQSTQTHVVQPGETLSAIAVRYGVTLNALMQYNNITDPNRIYWGEVLVIPPTGGTTGTVRTYVVQRGDQLRYIAARYDTTWQALAEANNLANPNWIYAGQVLVIPAVGGPVVQQPSPATGRYVVQYGDTLFAIAARYGVNMWDLARANYLLNLNAIYAGQSLVIP